MKRRTLLGLLPAATLCAGESPEPEDVRIAIVRGHNEKSPGAFSPSLRKSEWGFYREAEEIMLIQEWALPGLRVEHFLRPSGKAYEAEIQDAYKRVDAFRPDLILELHFNWSVRASARATNTLYWHESEASRSAAFHLQRAACRALSRPKSQESTVMPLYAWSRGKSSVLASGAPTLILEPSFAGSNDAEALLLQDHFPTFSWEILTAAKAWVESRK